MSDSTKSLQLLKNLVIMASSDGALTEREIAFLIDRCAELGLDESDLEASIEFALSDQASIKLPTNRDEQISLLGDLIRVMAADGSLSEIEKRLFALASARMGIDKTEIDSLIDHLLGKSPK